MRGHYLPRHLANGRWRPGFAAPSSLCQARQQPVLGKGWGDMPGGRRRRAWPLGGGLHHAVGNHRVGNFYEAGNVGAVHVVDIVVVDTTVLYALVVNVLHDVTQQLL
jgi:hypothetical protein